jgi:hypothetical protein
MCKPSDGLGWMGGWCGVRDGVRSRCWCRSFGAEDSGSWIVFFVSRLTLGWWCAGNSAVA